MVAVRQHVDVIIRLAENERLAGRNQTLDITTTFPAKKQRMLRGMMFLSSKSLFVFLFDR